MIANTKLASSAPSYAKLNLFLYVTDKRPDGYHNICSLFCAIDFYDTLSISPAKSTFLENTGLGVPVGKENIIMAVDTLLRQGYSLTQHFKISIHKRIPVGAGLGGGSSNACTYLELVNKAAGLGLTLEQMQDILGRVGSDAAFFLYRPMAIGTGRGEILSPFKFEEKLHFVLINPAIFISAASVYKDEKLQLTSLSDLPKMPTSNKTDDIISMMTNDLQAPVFARYPQLSEICERLELAGAAKAMMSGSGSTVFGVFKDSATQEAAYKAMQQAYPKYLVVKAESL
ncbi:MAG: 4-(cytidine 5'-diphospho)-2-C-methyl-D-erythritol kinase [Deferribacteraceae bacterium]|jgi:4-diphosphocytidyl-2-C-methyl-D-erythritol kinase|nr:4-(cytidine 5'-diphospho)-2-C-methyl-D-erythritol kinase [Deferribacteraceae bacterium]